MEIKAQHHCTDFITEGMELDFTEYNQVLRGGKVKLFVARN